MTAPLIDRIRRHVSMNGPLPLAEYMHWCLADKTHGYYQTKSVFGREGDFVTAPEVSQMFGELIGIWLIRTWDTLGRPNRFNLVEIGPGNGTLMRDILRAAKVDKDFSEAAHPVLIETSERLIDTQRDKLAEHENINWLKSLDDLDKHPALIIGNEFLDALPPRQYVKYENEWFERGVGIDEQNSLIWVTLPTRKLDTKLLPSGHEHEPDGAVFEISTIRESFVERMASHISTNTGAALLIDYGHIKSGFGDTFQAIAKHEFADPLACPGEADLTSHVDFEPLSIIATQTGCTAMPVISQGEFLLKLGLLERAGALGASKSTDEQRRITEEAERLALPHEMGDLFKVFAFSSRDALWPFTEFPH
ncbi:MAG: class I SAM-dependent methyltransferase [Rhizobiaceae bacterium]|nr:class I SAM-dependent methyltransferase [Rhizobiaceae bacterium]